MMSNPSLERAYEYAAQLQSKAAVPQLPRYIRLSEMKAKTKKTKVRRFDAADYIETPKDVALFLEATFEEAFASDAPGIVAEALGSIARSKGMATIAGQTGFALCVYNYPLALSQRGAASIRKV